MRVMLFTDTFYPQVNGVASCVNTLACCLLERGHEVVVCTVQTKHMRQTEQKVTAPESAFPIVRTRAAFAVPLYSDIHIAAPINLAIRRLARKFQPDIIHCHTPCSIGWQGVHISKAYHIPLLGTHHTLFGEYVPAYSRLGSEVNARLASWVRRYSATFYNQCDVTSSASHYLAADLLAAGLKRPLIIVPNSVDTICFRPLNNERQRQQAHTGPRLVYFGRMAAEKNLYRLIQLVEPVLRRYPNASFDMIGDGPLREQLQAFTQQCGLDQQIYFPGWLRGETLAERVASAQVCVSASLTENQPISLLESFACGVPVVALAAAGVPELVTDGSNGYLVDPDATPDQFARRLEQLIEQPALRQQMSKNALHTAQRYSRTACLRATITAYRETISIARATTQRVQKVLQPSLQQRPTVPQLSPSPSLPQQRWERLG